MAQARASVEAMDRMIRNVTKFMTNQQTLMSALRNDYATVGRNGMIQNTSSLVKH